MDESEFGGIVLPLIKMRHNSLYIYGNDWKVDALILYIQQYGVDVKGIIDLNPSKALIKRWDGIPCLHISELDKIPDPENVFVIIAVELVGIELADMTQEFCKFGIDKFSMIPGWERDGINGGYFQHGARVEYYRSHYEELKNVLLSLHDDESRNVMLEYIRATVQCDVYRLPDCDGIYKYHYGKTMENGKPEQLYIHKKDEVWLNCGACFGDSVFHYFANGFNAEKIFAVEADKSRWIKLRRNLKRLPAEYRKKVTSANIFIDENTDFDKLLKGKSLSLVNADIEGNELNLIQDISEVIVKDRPVIALCAYHKGEDLVELIPYLQSIVDEYSYVIRKYPSFFWWEITELVIYAIPNERLP